MNVLQAITLRKSVRKFLPSQVPDEKIIIKIIDDAKKAPSGGNLQPWKVYVLIGDELQKLKDAVAERIKSGSLSDGNEYNVYPPDISGVYKDRRTVNGDGLYSTIGIGTTEKWKIINFLMPQLG
jgi:nitroreductase